jgi:hypothetical protein
MHDKKKKRKGENIQFACFEFFSHYFFFIIIINMGVRASLRAPRLIPQILKLMTM